MQTVSNGLAKNFETNGRDNAVCNYSCAFTNALIYFITKFTKIIGPTLIIILLKRSLV